MSELVFLAMETADVVAVNDSSSLWKDGLYMC